MIPLNEPLIAEVLERITHPTNTERWNQGSWASRTACNTSFCFAGWVAHVSEDVEIDWGTVPSSCTCPTCQGGVTADYVILKETGEKQSISSFAQARLGLTSNEAAYLFAGSNTLADLTVHLDHFRARRLHPEPSPRPRLLRLPSFTLRVPFAEYLRPASPPITITPPEDILLSTPTLTPELAGV